MDVISTTPIEEHISKAQGRMQEAIGGSPSYGTPEYKEAIERSRAASEHHYSQNAHHPEHYKNGVRDMSLLDLLLWIADCKASGDRGSSSRMGDLLIFLRARYALGDQVVGILEATI